MFTSLSYDCIDHNREFHRTPTSLPKLFFINENFHSFHRNVINTLMPFPYPNERNCTRFVSVRENNNCFRVATSVNRPQHAAKQGHTRTEVWVRFSEKKKSNQRRNNTIPIQGRDYYCLVTGVTVRGAAVNLAQKNSKKSPKQKWINK